MLLAIAMIATEAPAQFAPPPIASVGPADVAAPPQMPHAPAGQPVVAPQATGEPIAATEILAIVGDQVILAGELLPSINQHFKQFEGQISDAELDQHRRQAIKSLLPQLIETKLLYADFLRTVPPDRVKEIFDKLAERFDEAKLEGMMKKAEVNNLLELEEKLRAAGSTLEKERRRFAEQMLAQEMVRRNVDYEPVISLNDMLAYYHEHRAEFEFAEQVRWEALSVHFSRTPAKPEAWRAAAQMGNRVLRGAPLPEVAKQESHGFDAAEGGQHDWTKRGELASQKIEEAIFTIEVGKLSPIIEDDLGFHIVRVIERKAAGVQSFEDSQASIKESLRKQRVQKQVTEYLDKLRTRTRVQNFLGDSQPLEELAREGADPLR